MPIRMGPNMSKEEVNNKESREREYGLFLKNIGLRRVYLKRAKYELFTLEEIPENKSISIQFSSQPECKLEGKEKLVILHGFQIVGNIKNAGEKLFKIEGEFCLEYSVKEVPAEEMMDQFVKRHHVMHVWPYMREFIQNVTRRMEIPPLVLPLSCPLKDKNKEK